MAKDPLSKELLDKLSTDDKIGIIGDIIEPHIPPIWKGDIEVCLKPNSHYFYTRIKNEKERLIDGYMSDYYIFVHLNYLSCVDTPESVKNKMWHQILESYRGHMEKFADFDYKTVCKELDKEISEC